MMPATSMPMVTATAPATSPASVANSRGVAVVGDRGLEDSVDETASDSVMLFLFQGSRNLQVHPTDAAVVLGWQVMRVFADLLTSSFDQDVGMDLATVDLHDLRPDEQDAVRSLILEGLREHWGSVDPTLNPDLDDLAVTYATGRVLVASDGAGVVGTGSVIRRDDATAEIVRMSVASEYRRAGLGRRLVADLVATASSWGMSRVVLETSAHWKDAVEFYVRCGFTQTHFESGTFGRDAWFEMKLEQQDTKQPAGPEIS
jgi:putative acetyltransferase